MLGSIKDALRLYRENFLKVLLIGTTIILPIQIIYTILVNYVTMPFNYFNIPLWTSIFQSIFMLISLSVMEIPMISMAAQDTRTNKVKTGKLYGDTLKNAFFAYLISIPFAIITTAGLIFFIIPGVILLVLFMGIPFVKVIEDESVKTVVKRSFSFGKENFLSLCGLLLLFAAIDFIGTYICSFTAIVFTGQMAVVNWAMMIFNMFLLPLFVFSVAKLYLSWNGEADIIREEDYFQQLEQYR